ncbi:hypothetical protein IQ26_06164 [Mesorhizobium tianshanense]|uniref:Uncharacterized protein n=1 Tax=Mesorhizobium tianshanense TaxID=39844 RepID=A0A562MZ97_9HYPH|nr:hypothetical protein IQ26_06164 [Mesorhizobium tianshanense]
MNSKSHPRFDPHALRGLVGDAVFARGEAYFQDGMVDILARLMHDDPSERRRM